MTEKSITEEVKYLKLDSEKVRALFKKHSHQSDILIAIYMMCFPNWGDIKSVGGFPKVNKSTSISLMQLFMAFDRKNHPTVVCGGLWMNNGFSSLDSEHLEDWRVDLSECNVKLNDDI